MGFDDARYTALATFNQAAYSRVELLVQAGITRESNLVHNNPLRMKPVNMNTLTD